MLHQTETLFRWDISPAWRWRAGDGAVVVGSAAGYIVRFFVNNKTRR